jgi:hypothetical protein
LIEVNGIAAGRLQAGNLGPPFHVGTEARGYRRREALAQAGFTPQAGHRASARQLLNKSCQRLSVALT